jgi:hypothetical protein
MLRWLATAAIAALLVLNLWMPSSSLGRRGNEAKARLDEPAAFASVGSALPQLALLDLEGRPFPLENLRGHRVLITFERSVDW